MHVQTLRFAFILFINNVEFRNWQYKLDVWKATGRDAVACTGWRDAGSILGVISLCQVRHRAHSCFRRGKKIAKQ